MDINSTQNVGIKKNLVCLHFFSELSLQHSRSTRIHEAMDVMYSEAGKLSSSGTSVASEDVVLVTTADEDNDSERKRKQKISHDNAQKTIDSTINVILHVKKIKRDLHIQ